MPYRRIVLTLTALVAATVASGSEASTALAVSSTSPNLRVAFIGDQAINANAEAVLNLIAAEGAEMVLHQGDLGYGNEADPQTAIDWDAQITSILGADFPYFASVGNHDVGNWPTYQQLLLDRLGLVPDASCTGEYGVQATCTYKGLFFILSGAGTMGSDHATYISDQLALDSSIWRVCTWHKNQTAMQVGLKTNEVGWGPYEACREADAIIATAHEHSYSRTRTLISTEFQTVDSAWPDPNTLRVSAGSTFEFVSGIAGRSIRNQDRCLPTTVPYGCNGEWASIYTSDQSATYGALFIDFNVGGSPTSASGYFKDITGNTIDSFTVESQIAKPVGGIASLPDLVGGEPSEGGSALIFQAGAILLIVISVAAGLAFRSKRQA